MINFVYEFWVKAVVNDKGLKGWKTIKPSSQKVVAVTCENCWFARFHLKGSDWEKFGVLE